MEGTWRNSLNVQQRPGDAAIFQCPFWGNKYFLRGYGHKTRQVHTGWARLASFRNFRKLALEKSWLVRRCQAKGGLQRRAPVFVLGWGGRGASGAVPQHRSSPPLFGVCLTCFDMFLRVKAHRINWTERLMSSFGLFSGKPEAECVVSVVISFIQLYAM